MKVAHAAPAWLVTLAFVVGVQVVASAIQRGSDLKSQPNLQFFFHGYLETMDGVPPLVRWDSIWYVGMALEGYTGDRADSRLTAGFLPLYPLLMRCVGDLTRCDYFTAGIWISRFALFTAVALLAAYAREREGGVAPGWAAVGTLLAFPSAFILVSAYAESLFLALALGAFVLTRRGRYAWAALAAFGAALTRIHGLALVPALGVLGWEQWRMRPTPNSPQVGTDFTHARQPASTGTVRPGSVWRSDARCLRCGTARVFLPLIGAAAAYVTLAGYFWVQFRDPLRYVAAKREGWGQGFTPPWETLATAIDHLEHALARLDLGAILTALELPCFYLTAAVVVLLGARRWWAETTYVASVGAMSLCSSYLTSLPRYTLLMFHLFVVLGGLRRRPALLAIYLVAGVLLQGCLLMHFVRFEAPPP